MMAQIVDYTALAVLIAAVPVTLWSAWRHRRAAWRSDLSPLWRPFLAVILALVISYYTAIDQERAALQLLVWLGYLAVYYVARRTPHRWVLSALRTTGWLVAGVTLAEALVTNERAGWWLMGNPNKVGGLLAVLLPLSSHSLWMLVGWAALLATESRGAIVGVLSSVAASARKQRLVVAILAVLAVTVVLAMMRPRGTAQRWDYWWEATGLFIERPLTGWGAGCYPLLTVTHGPLHPHAESFPLTVAAEQGLIGLAAWGWLVIGAARLAARSESRARLGLLAFAVHNLVDCTLWWWWIGIAVMMCLSLTEEVRDGSSVDCSVEL